MANDGFHEPLEKLSEATLDMHRAIVSLMEEKYGPIGGEHEET